LDLDGSGRISEQELDEVRRRRSEERREAGLPAMRGQRRRGRRGSPPAFSDFDLDGDGVVTEQQFRDARTARIAKRVREGGMMRGLVSAPTFSDLDTDGDGRLTPDEFAAVERHQRGGMRGSAPERVDP
jgi:Ca2+-binding EF-hand superfamily protein